MNNRIKILDLGRMDYKPSWDFQKNFHQDVLSGKENDTLILVEHEPVYTLGKNANKEHLLDKSNSRVKVYNVERGGDITFHGPGQLVGYPILNLNNFKKNFRSFSPLICFAVKSFTYVNIIREIKKFGLGADVVSVGELMMALKAGINPSKIVFSGVGKTTSEISFAIDKKILLINAESLSEIKASPFVGKEFADAI